MELIPKAVVVGLITPPALPGGPAPVTVDKINRLWAEVAGTYGYQNLQILAGGSGANFMGATPEDGVTVQPPVIQVRDLVQMTVEQSAHKVQEIFGAVERQLGIGLYLNLGVKVVYNAPTSMNDGRGFVIGQLLGKTDADLEPLTAGGTVWAGVKYVAGLPDRQYVVTVEPLQSDPRMLFIDLDAQFHGQAALDAIASRVHDCEQYVTKTVAGYLD